jgi:hypothetical protein
MTGNYSFIIDTQLAIYIVLGLLVLAFLFFIINTIRCYLTRPRFDDEEEMEEYDQHHGVANPQKSATNAESGYQRSPSMQNQGK